MKRRTAGLSASVAALLLAVLSAHAQATPLLDVSAGEISGYSQIYQLNITSNPNYSQPIPYGVNNSAQVFPWGIDRIAYYMELQTAAGGREWVWVSVDAFTQDLTKIGVPGQVTTIFWQQLLNNMNIESNDPSIVTGAGIATGNIEFWSLNYGTANGLPVPGASGSVYDFGDQPGGGNHGSMQIHNYGAQQTLFALNRFNRGEVAELGLGPNLTGSGHPDWTFNQNAGTYTLANFEVWVRAVPEPATLSLLVLGGLGLWHRRRRR